MSDVTMREMLGAGVHFGHQTRYWNPAMAPYLFGQRNKIHIINLEKTLPLYQEAMNFAGQIIARKGVILFVGTKRAAQNIITEEAKRCDMPYVNRRWVGGLLTNFRTMRTSVKRLEEIETLLSDDNSIERISKKERLMYEHELRRLGANLSGIKEMKSIPDALFVIDVGYENIAVKEAVKLGIAVIGVVDSNNSPEGIDYIIPGNDDAIRSIRIYAKGMADTILESRDSLAYIDDDEADDELIEVDQAGMPVAEDIAVRISTKASRKKTAGETDDTEADGVKKPIKKAHKKAVAKAVGDGADTEGATNKTAVKTAVQIIKLKQPEKPYRSNSARALYWERIQQFDGKPLDDFRASVKENPPSTPSSGKLKGKPEPLSGWIRFFEQEGLLELVDKNER